MSAEDDLLALVKTSGVDTYDGYLDVDESEKVITVDLPYLVFYSGLGDDIDERQGGRHGGVAVEFQITYVAESPESARFARDAARAVLDRRRVPTLGRRAGVIKRTDSSWIRRDDDYTRPGNEPLYYGVDQYQVGT